MHFYFLLQQLRLFHTLSALLLDFMLVLGCLGELFYSEPEALSYEIFM